jgi:methylenetetrahydrofolate reductase (NADPH)
MSELRPAWIHVTWGAGGSTQERSLDLAGAAQGMGIDACLHITCTNMEKSMLDQTLEVRLRPLSGRENEADHFFEFNPLAS